MCILEIWGYTFYNGGVDEMKKIILVVLLISVFGCVAEAKEGVEEINMTGQVIMKVDSNKAFVDTLETYIDYNDNAITPIVDNDVVFIPLRFVAQNIDSKVLWNKKDNSITIYKDNRDIQIWDNSTTVLVSGIEKLLKYQPRIIKNRIYMEVNDFANLLKCTVFINGEFIIFDKSGDAEKFPTVSILEEMYCEYPNTGRNLYPICKPLSTTGSGLVSQIGFMDKHGKMVIEPVHTIVENQSKYFTQGLFCTSKEIINEKGEVIYEIPYGGKVDLIQDGIISIVKDGPLPPELDIFPIYLDMRFRNVTNLVAGKRFNKGLNIFENKGRWYAENRSGNLIIEFPDGVQTAKVVTAPETNQNESKSYIIFEQMGKVGLMNLNGEILLEPIYNRIKILANNIFAVYEKETDIPLLLDITGELGFSLVDMDITELYENLIVVKDNGYLGVIKTNGTVILACKYEDVKVNNNMILAKEKGKYKVFSDEGILLLSTDNTNMSFVYDLIYFENDQECGYMDYKFNIVYGW